VWDWSLLPGVSSEQLKVSDPGDLVWVPHRFGSLGLIQPSINYLNVRRAFGRFAHLSDLLSIGIYGKYGVRMTPSPNGRNQLIFPKFLSFAQLTHSRVGEIDWHLWPVLAEIYAALDDWSIDTMASCRNITAATLTLWTQLVFWRNDLIAACSILQEAPEEKRTIEERRNLQSAIAGANAAVSHFAKKMRYWEDRDRVISEVKQVAASTELGAYVPATETHGLPFPESPLKALFGLRDLLDATHSIVHGLFTQHRLTSVPVDPTAAQAALILIRERTGSQDWQFRELATLWFGTETTVVAEYVESLVTTVTSVMERETGLPISDQRAHYKSVMERYYPLRGTVNDPRALP